MTAISAQSADTIDLADVARALRRGWRAVVAFTVLGVLGALAVIMFAAPKFAGSATLVIKTGSDATGSVLTRLTGGLGDAAGGMLSGALKSPMETELQILQSRAIAEQVIDSLELQARVLAPRELPSTTVVQSLQLAPSFTAAKFHFARSGNVYQVTGPSFTGTTTASGAVQLPVGTVVLRPDLKLSSFDVELRDPEDAVKRFQKYLVVDKAGGEVASVTYRAGDSLTAAAVPNALVATYLARRTTTDRGTNQHRVEFLVAKADSFSRQLSAAEDSLRRQQEHSGVIDPETVGKIELQRASQLRGSLGELQVEEGAVKQLVSRVTDGSVRPRELAAFPTFLKSPAINDLISQLNQVETERLKLLETRTEKDPQVVALANSARNLEGQLLPLAREYSSSVTKQRSEVQLQLDSLQGRIGGLPAVAESGLRLQRDVLRLGQIYGAVQAELVQARLAAIAEGGDVRALDLATVAKKPVFPNPAKTAAIGIGGGLLCGLVAALLIGMLGRWMQDATDVERITGLPAFRLDPAAPLLIGGMASQTVLVIPLDDRARAEPVAQQIAQTALARALTATVLDLSSLNGAAKHSVALTTMAADSQSPTASPNVAVNASIERLEQEYGMVVVQLPGIGSTATAAALRPNRPVILVAPSQRIDRGVLMGAVQTLKRLDVPCAGVVLSGAEKPRALVG